MGMGKSRGRHEVRPRTAAESDVSGEAQATFLEQSLWVRSKAEPFLIKEVTRQVLNHVGVRLEAAGASVTWRALTTLL